MNEKNLQTEFQIIDFMLYNLKLMINLNFKSKIHALSNFNSTNIVFKNPNILKITKNALQNFIKLKFKIIIY